QGPADPDVRPTPALSYRRGGGGPPRRVAAATLSAARRAALLEPAVRIGARENARFPSMTANANVLELIGNTPMVKAQHLDTGVCELYLKLECMNPGGSIKDRIGLKMIEAAEARGDLKPGALIVERTAGNTGIGLA